MVFVILFVLVVAAMSWWLYRAMQDEALAKRLKMSLEEAREVTESLEDSAYIHDLPRYHVRIMLAVGCTPQEILGQIRQRPFLVVDFQD